MWYLLLRPFDLARVRTHLSFAAGAPEWADSLAVALQVGLLLGARGRRGARPRGAFAQPSRSPPWRPRLFPVDEPDLQSAVRDRPLRCVGGGCGARRRHTLREQLAVGVAAALVSAANAFVYPFALPRYDVMPRYDFTWVACSAGFFVLAIALTTWLALSARRLSIPA